MQTIGIGELQRNMGILTRLTEPITIMDKRKNRAVAIVTPPVGSHEDNIIERMSRQLQEKSRRRGIVIEDLEKAKEEAMEMAMREKYGFTD